MKTIFFRPLLKLNVCVYLFSVLSLVASCTSTKPDDESDQLQDVDDDYTGISSNSESYPWIPPRGTGPLDRAKSQNPYSASSQKPYFPQSSSNPYLGKPPTKNFALEPDLIEKTSDPVRATPSKNSSRNKKKQKSKNHKKLKTQAY